MDNASKLILFFILSLTLIGTAQAVEPFDSQAGMCAYVNVGNLSLENATEAYTQILTLSATHSVGTINIANYGGSDNIHVYVDTEGWIVAYLERGEELGSIIQWSGIDYNSPVIKTTLEDAINSVCKKINVDFADVKTDIKYYNFEYPDAENMLIFINMIVGEGDEYTTLFFPESYTLYCVNYSHMNRGSYSYSRSTFYFDGVVTSDLVANGYSRRNHYYTLEKEVPHTIRLYNYETGAGLANILIYNQP